VYYKYRIGLSSENKGKEQEKNLLQAKYELAIDAIV
jgi:hypothetical protein